MYGIGLVLIKYIKEWEMSLKVVVGVVVGAGVDYCVTSCGRDERMADQQWEPGLVIM